MADSKPFLNERECHDQHCCSEHGYGRPFNFEHMHNNIFLSFSGRLLVLNLQYHSLNVSKQ